MHAKGGSIFASPTVVILQQLIFSWSSSAIVIAVLGLVVSSWLSVSLVLVNTHFIMQCGTIIIPSIYFPIIPIWTSKTLGLCGWADAIWHRMHGCFRMHGCRVLFGVGSAFHDMIAPRMHGCHWLARMRCQNPGTLRLGGCNLAPDARMLSDARMSGTVWGGFSVS